jgi:hypothetical protein
LKRDEDLLHNSGHVLDPDLIVHLQHCINLNSRHFSSDSGDEEGMSDIDKMASHNPEPEPAVSGAEDYDMAYIPTQHGES